MKRLVDAALRLPPIAFISDVVGLYFSCKVARSAAELAYFLVLSFFPILICLSAFVSKLNLNLTDWLQETSYVLPHGVMSILQDYLQYISIHQSDAMIIAGLMMSALFAASAMRGLMNVMQEVYGRPTFQGVRQLVVSLIFAILLLITTFASIMVVVTGNWFFRLLGGVFHLDDLVVTFVPWQWSKYLLLTALVFLFILLLYRFVTPMGKPRPPVVPGAFLAAIALTLSSMIFSAFIENSTKYSLVYGSLASLMILLVWLYLCGNILITGNLINCVLYRNKRPHLSS